MAYKDRFGSTKIINKPVDTLSIGWDYDVNPEDVKRRFPVMLFTPDMNDTSQHWHIRLNRKQAFALCEWLGDFLDGKPTKYKKRATTV